MSLPWLLPAEVHLPRLQCVADIPTMCRDFACCSALQELYLRKNEVSLLVPQSPILFAIVLAWPCDALGTSLVMPQQFRPVAHTST